MTTRILCRSSLGGLAIVLALAACKPRDESRLYDSEGDLASDRVVRFTILQLNDVYEISPVEGGQRGGLARVATIRQRLLEENANTYTILDGDFLSPSAMSATKIDGQPVAGAQMVATLNKMGLDYAALGNHEFDIAEADLKKRIGESQFKWVTANVLDAQGQLFPGVRENDVIVAKNAKGDQARIGLFGVCIDMVKKPWLTYKKAIPTAKEQVEVLEPQTDLILAMTHLSMAEDKQLAAEVPEIAAVFGGHEHENASAFAGEDSTPIYKADANARTVYVHKFRYDARDGALTRESNLVEIDKAIPEEEQTKTVADAWQGRVFDAIRASGVEPQEVVGRTDEILEGFEASVRNRPTNLSKLIAEAFLKEDAEADAAVYGSGSIRIDDRIPPGDITRYDVIRIFPFGGNLSLVEISGKLLKKALDQGEANRGSGGYLVHANIDRAENGIWRVKGDPIDDAKKYKVVFNDFLLTGQEKGLSFLNTTLENEQLRKMRDTRDVRTVFVAKLLSGETSQ